MERLAAQIPKPRVHLVLYAGVLAPKVRAPAPGAAVTTQALTVTVVAPGAPSADGNTFTLSAQREREARGQPSSPLRRCAISQRR